MQAYERFLKYVVVDTESDAHSETVPSTEKQKNLGRMLVDEMKEMGIADAFLDDKGYVYGTIPAAKGCEDAPVIGLIAHMDTVNVVSGANVKPRIVHNYDGKEIVLNEELSIVMKPEEFPSLLKYVGEDLIVTDGTTILGADDKAGIAEILTVAEYFLTHPEEPHGTIKIGFTPDEEVGRGANHFDVKGFGADFAYTVDGGEIGELAYENFNAASAKVTIQGRSVHTGSAKGVMLNSQLVAMEFHNMLPQFENPAYTEGREGFSHLDEMHGDVETTILHYIIRDHDAEKFEQKKQRFQAIADYLNARYGADTVELELKNSYRNMIEQIRPNFALVEKAREAFLANGIQPFEIAVRGGTDGARLSFMGLPCPNLCTGGHNCHGRYEYISIQSMDKTVNVIKTLLSLFTK